MLWIGCLFPAVLGAVDLLADGANQRAASATPRWFRFGVPLPPGAVHDASRLCVMRGRGGVRTRRPLVGHCDVRTRHPDGSAHWIGVEVRSMRSVRRLHVCRVASRVSSVGRLRVRREEDALVVDGVGRTWRFEEGRASIPWSLTQRARPVVAAGRGVRIGGGTPMRWGRWRSTHPDGRDRDVVTLIADAVAPFDPEAPSSPASPPAFARLRVRIVAGEDSVDCRVLREGRASPLEVAIPVAEVLRLQCGTTSARSVRRRDRRPHVPPLAVASDGRATLGSKPADWTGVLRVALRGDHRARERACLAVVDVVHRGGLAVSNERGGLVLRPAPMHGGPGFRERLRFRWWWRSDESGHQLARRARAWAADPSGALVWRASRSSVPGGGAMAVPAVDPGRAFERTLARLLDAYDDPAARTPRDVGDYRVAHLGWANGEYDAIGVLVRGALWTRRAAAWRWARRAVHHLLDVDHDRDGSGLPYRHGAHHDGGIDLGHVWLGGLLHYGFVADDADARAAAEAIANGVASGVRRHGFTFRREREYGWMLEALVHAASRWPRFERPRDRLANAVLETVEDGLCRVERDADGGRARTTTFTGLGILVPALAAWSRVTGDPRGLAVASRMVAAYRDAAWDPERGRLAWSIHVNLRAREPTRRTGRVRGGDLLFVAGGVASVPAARAWAAELARHGARQLARRDYGRDAGERVRALRGLLDLAGVGIVPDGTR